MRKVNTNYEIICFNALIVPLSYLSWLPFNLSGILLDRNRRDRTQLYVDLAVIKWACKNHENCWNTRFDVTSWFRRRNAVTLCEGGYDVTAIGVTSWFLVVTSRHT
jgi:hypothetical protein